jgi:hypothetical protein
MHLLNQYLQFRLGLSQPLHKSNIDGGSLRLPSKEDEFSSASTASIEDGENDATTLHSHSENELEDFPTLAGSNSIDSFSQINSIPIEYSINEPHVLDWIVDAKKLRTRDQQIISPVFELGPNTSGRLMLKPTSKGDKKRQTTFLKSSGCGSIEFKLVQSEQPAPNLGMSVSIGKGSQARTALAANKHDFSESSVCRLGDEWNFRNVIDAKSARFLVSVKVFW